MENLANNIPVWAAFTLLVALIGWVIRLVSTTAKVQTKMSVVETQINGLGRRLDENARELRQLVKELKDETLREIQDRLHEQELRVTVIETMLTAKHDPSHEGVGVCCALDEMRELLTHISAATDALSGKLDRLQTTVNRLRRRGEDGVE